MTLASRVSDLAVAVRTKINAMMPRLMPSGGGAGQVLTKDSTTDFAASWQTPAVGGGGGSQEVFVQQTRPAGLGPWTWWVQDVDGKIINLIVADGSP